MGRPAHRVASKLPDVELRQHVTLSLLPSRRALFRLRFLIFRKKCRFALNGSVLLGEQYNPDLKQVVENVRATVGEKTWQAFEMLTKFENDAKTVARELGMKLGAVYQAKYRVLELLNREYAARIVGADNLEE